MGGRVDYLIHDRQGKLVKFGHYSLNNVLQRKRFGKIVADALCQDHIITTGMSTLPAITVLPAAPTPTEGERS